MIAILAGGRAQRMGRGVKSINMTKGLMEIPIFGGGSETVIDRLIRQLKKAKAINGPEDILLCVGYKENLVREKYPECKFLTTFDINDPSEALVAFHKTIETFCDNEFVFIMGDSVWSQTAMDNFIAVSDNAPMVVYHGTDPNYCEIFGVSLNGSVGFDLVRKVNACKSMPVVPGEIRWELENKKTIPPRDCRTSCMEKFIDDNKLPGKLRVYQSGKVDDIDWDEDHKRICEHIKAGRF